MSATITITIPCKPLVSKYIKHEHGPEVKLDRNTAVGKYFLGLVSKDYERHENYQNIEQFSDQLSILISEDVHARNGHLLSHTNIVEFNEYITQVVHRRLFDVIDAYKEANHRGFITEGLKGFYKKFGIAEEEFSYGAAKMAYHRYVNRRVTKQREAA